MGNCSLFPTLCLRASQIEVTAEIENIENAVIKPNTRTQNKKKHIEFTLSPTVILYPYKIIGISSKGIRILA